MMVQVTRKDTPWRKVPLSRCRGRVLLSRTILEQLARATGIPLPADSEQLPATYVGQRVEIVIAHAVRRGLRTAVIKKLSAAQG